MTEAADANRHGTHSGQRCDGRGMLLRYVSGYVPNFSDSFTSEWLNDAASDYSVARRVLTDYHPMILCDEDVRKLEKLP